MLGFFSGLLNKLELNLLLRICNLFYLIKTNTYMQEFCKTSDNNMKESQSVVGNLYGVSSSQISEKSDLEGSQTPDLFPNSCEQVKVKQVRYVCQ